MRKVLFIFGNLSDGDIEWLAAVGQRKSFATGHKACAWTIPARKPESVTAAVACVRQGSKKG